MGRNTCLTSIFSPRLVANASQIHRAYEMHIQNVIAVCRVRMFVSILFLNVHVWADDLIGS